MALTLKTIVIELNHGATARIPYWEVDSGKKGPRLLVTAAQHGTELQGSEVIRRFAPFAAKELKKGRCVLVPMVNLPAIERRQPHIDYVYGRYYGNDNDNNLNCSWPGDPKGTAARRLSNALKAAVVDDADACIDLHCWCSRLATAIQARENVPANLELAAIGGLPFARRYPKQPALFPDGDLLTSLFNCSGRPGFTIEFRGQNVIHESEVVRGVRAMRNFFRYFGMLSGEMELAGDKTIWMNEAEEIQIAAPVSGLFLENGLRPGDAVTEGQTLGWVLRADNLESVEVRAPVSGRLFQYGPVPNEKKNVSEIAQSPHPYIDAEQVAAVIVRTNP